MKLTTLLLSTLPTTLACLEASGQISTTGQVLAMSVTDNGLNVCNADWGWRIDQDDHFSLTCLSGYIYATTQDGSFAWYRNGDETESWVQPWTSGDGDIITWDVTEYC